MSGALDRRLEALRRAVEAADGRLDPEAVGAARAVVERAGARLGLGVETTVVALAGPTGAGKSTLFNRLAGSDLVTAGARRPTTSTTTAAVWGDTADPLLDWLEVPLRHRVGDFAKGGLVVLDLPDFDSVESAHREEVDRVVEMADLIVWVVDPQKYADASLHENYLRPLAAHGESMVVALNQSDLLPPAEREACANDLRRLLTADGLSGTPVLTLSGRTGDGVEELRKLLDERAARREAAAQRLAADTESAAARLEPACEGEARSKVPARSRQRLLAALAAAAGVPAVVSAVARSHRRRASLATGWPLLRWLRRLRPDPLRRLGLGDAARPDALTSLPAPSPVTRAQADSAIRDLAAEASEGLPDPWPGLVRSAATRGEDELADRLDRAVGGAKLGGQRTPLWWRAAGLLQKVLLVAMLAGAIWLVLLIMIGYLQLTDALPDLPEVEGVPLPTLLLVGGVLAGWLVALLSRLVAGVGAGRRARRAERALRDRVAAVADETVIGPLEAELTARSDLCSALAQARGGR